AYPAIADFVRTIGRRKLIMPTYQALVATEAGLEFAKQQLAAARPGYHPITTGSVERVIAEADPAPGSGTPVVSALTEPEVPAAPEADDDVPVMPAADGDPTRPAPIGN